VRFGEREKEKLAALFLTCASMTSPRLSSTADTCLRLGAVLAAIASRIWALEYLSLSVLVWWPCAEVRQSAGRC
jgi:hypothetical protein